MLNVRRECASCVWTVRFKWFSVTLHLNHQPSSQSPYILMVRVRELSPRSACETWSQTKKCSQKFVNLSATQIQRIFLFPSILMYHKKGSATQYASRMREWTHQLEQIYYGMTTGAQCDLLLWWQSVTVLRSAARERWVFQHRRAMEAPQVRWGWVWVSSPGRCVPLCSAPCREGQEEHTSHSWSARFPVRLDYGTTRNPYEAIPAIVSDGVGWWWRRMGQFPLSAWGLWKG